MASKQLFENITLQKINKWNDKIMLNDIFYEWRPSILINDPHMYMLSFFLPTERLWAFECVSDPYRPLYSQITYIQHMSRKYKFEQKMELFYETLTNFFHLTPKQIKELPTSYQKRSKIQELQKLLDEE